MTDLPNALTVDEVRILAHAFFAADPECLDLTEGIIRRLCEWADAAGSDETERRNDGPSQ